MRYYVGSDLPAAQLTLRNGDGTYPDFSSGYTFSVKVAPVGSSTASFTKTTTITGGVGSKTVANVTITWATTGELNTLTAGFYTLQITVTQTSGSGQWIEQVPLEVVGVIS